MHRICALGIACYVALHATAWAADVILLDSRPGDFVGGGALQQITSADGTFGGTATDDEVHVSFFGVPGHFWLLDFAAAPSETLTTGYYDDATRWPFADLGPGLAVSGDGRGCSQLSGRFEILELERDGAGGLVHFAADFEQHCEDRAFVLYGAVRFHSDVPITRPCGDEDGDGKADATDECAGTPQGERVDEAGCSVAQFCERIDAAAGAGRRLCRAADWLNDGAGKRRPSRDCQVVRTSGALARCEPREPASRPDSELELVSEPGDFIGGGRTRLFTRADGDFAAFLNFGNEITIFFDNFARNTAPSEFWNLTFAGAAGAPPTPGRYPGAVRAPFRGAAAGIEIDGDGRGCNTLHGSFEVLDYVIGPDDRVDRFEATFEQFCEVNPAPLRGRIRYVRPKPFGLTCLDTDGDGEDDATDRCAATPAAAAVDQAGCSLAQFCAAVDLSSGKGSVCGAADWRNDSPRRSPRDCRVAVGQCAPSP
jgi:hypothetical protein